ncbi:helix-turn-helix domain-containing protein [Streptomyces sp. JJ36]|nr:helix-turn-helix domain-containing protein [Streptomyces sp. JJ36]
MHELEVPEPHLLPFAIGTFDTIGPLSRAAFPHRHTFHEIVYVTHGSGSHVVDLRRHPLRPPELCVIAPGQVHHWDARELHGWVLLFDDAFLLAHPGDRDLLHHLAEHPRPRLDRAAVARLRPLVTGLLAEYRERGPGMVSVLQALLHILVVRAVRALGAARYAREPHVVPAPSPPHGPHESHGPQGLEGLERPGELRQRPDGPAGTPEPYGTPEPSGLPGPPASAAALARRFTRLLARRGADGQLAVTVRGCAAELGVSAGYLTEAVKAATGRTPGSLIRHAQVLEAKRLLAGTGLTVGRVARAAGFSDPAYFCRFFRRETGLSPGEFRRAAHGTAAAPVRKHHTGRTPSIDPGEGAP